MCEFVCLSLRRTICLCAWNSKDGARFLSQSVSKSYFLSLGHQLNMQCDNLAKTGWSVGFKDLPDFTSPVLGLQAHATMPGIF